VDSERPNHNMSTLAYAAMTIAFSQSRIAEMAQDCLQDRG